MKRRSAGGYVADLQGGGVHAPGDDVAVATAGDERPLVGRQVDAGDAVGGRVPAPQHHRHDQARTQAHGCNTATVATFTPSGRIWRVRALG